jgi:hypothetical protein
MKKYICVLVFSLGVASHALSAAVFDKYFELSVGAGPFIPASQVPFTDLASTLYRYSFKTGLGYFARCLVKVTKKFSLGAAFSEFSFGSGPPDVRPYGTYYYKYACTDFLGVLQWKPGQGKLRPYVLAGVGSSKGKVTLEQAAGVFASPNQLLLQPGIGASLALKKASLFLEVKYTHAGGGDLSRSYLPVNAGILF